MKDVNPQYSSLISPYYHIFLSAIKNAKTVLRIISKLLNYEKGLTKKCFFLFFMSK